MKANTFMNRIPRPIFAALVIALFIAFATMESEAQVQAKLQAAIFVKLLNYDSSLAQKPQSQLKFHIVIDAKTSPGQDAIKKEFAVISRQKISGKNIIILITPVGELATANSEESTHVFYLPDGSTRATLNAAVQLGAQHKIPVLAGNAVLAVGGAAVGITVSNGKPQIIVNLKQSKSMGMNLSSQLLKLAKVI